MAAPKDEPSQRNGRLAIPLPFEDALKAATEVPADKLAGANGQKPAPKKPRQKKPVKKG